MYDHMRQQFDNYARNLEADIESQNRRPEHHVQEAADTPGRAWLRIVTPAAALGLALVLLAVFS